MGIHARATLKIVQEPITVTLLIMFNKVLFLFIGKEISVSKSKGYNTLYSKLWDLS